jgi:hypothetical protein
MELVVEDPFRGEAGVSAGSGAPGPAAVCIHRVAGRPLPGLDRSRWIEKDRAHNRSRKAAMATGQVLTRYDVTDLNNGAVDVFPVADPPGWDDISLYYARALLEMGWKESPEGETDVESMWEYSEDPASYFFQAAMHWWPKHSGIPPAPYDERWSHCTHGPAQTEQFFLPWHRGYIYFFEVIVRAKVAALGGPESWSLPYWNYSDMQGADPGVPWPRSNLPWVFCQPTLPDGATNPLYIADVLKRGLQPTWPGTQETMYLNPGTPYYAAAYAHPDYEGFNATLDGRPHGQVHVDTGTGDGQIDGGWMTRTVTASFDPIFWLHHAEIDRFWVGWNANGNENPQDDGWLEAEADPMHTKRWNFWANGDLGNKLVVRPGQMVDPENLGDPFPYSYRYQNLPATPRRVAGRQMVREAMPELAARPPVPHDAATREIAAAEEPVELGTEAVSVAIPLSDEVQEVVDRLVAESPADVTRLVLRVDNVVAEGTTGDYEIYLNYSEATLETLGEVPNFVGILAGFGADHHHDQGNGDGDAHHGVGGRYELTALVAFLLEQGSWNRDKATITFVPAPAVRRPAQLVAGPLRVGRVSIHAD